MRVFSFIPFEKHHLPLFMQWLRAPHVKTFWQESADIAEVEEKFLRALPARSVRSFIIREDKRLIGYIQYYEAAKIGKGYWPDEAPDTYGVDIIIGEESLTGKGTGSAALSAFTDFLRTEKKARKIIIDPDPDNAAAIRAFEKAGFRKDGEVQTPSGPAMLMSMVFQ